MAGADPDNAHMCVTHGGGG